MILNADKTLQAWADLRIGKASAIDPYEVICRDYVEVNGVATDPEKKYFLKKGDEITGRTMSQRTILCLVTQDCVLVAGKYLCDWMGHDHHLYNMKGEEIHDYYLFLTVTFADFKGSIKFVDQIGLIGEGPQTEEEHHSSHKRLCDFVRVHKRAICLDSILFNYLTELCSYKEEYYGHNNPMKQISSRMRAEAILRSRYSTALEEFLQAKKDNRGVPPRKAYGEFLKTGGVLPSDKEEVLEYLRLVTK
jgi:hypothetical protein